MRHIVNLLITAALLHLIVGCSPHRSEADFIPSDEIARRALTVAMEAWQKGMPAGPVAGTSPVIHVTDSTRTSGRKLLSWKLLGAVPGNAPRCYALSLTLDQPTETRRERFIVVGIDPLWVFRHEDYDLLMHWEHPMSDSDATAKSTGSTGEETKREQ